MSKFTIYGLLLLLIISGIIAGWIYFQQSRDQTKTEGNIFIKPVQTPLTNIPIKDFTASPSADLEPAPSSTESAWLEYSDNEFYFRYPPDVALTNENVSDGTVSIGKWGPTQKPDTEFYDGLALTFSLVQIDQTDLRTYVEARMIEDSQIGEVLSDISEIKINDYQGFAYLISGLGLHTYSYIQDDQSNKIIMIVDSTIDPTNRGFKAQAEQVLHSFRFVH